jgi:ADP-ribose pyrophosphatase YjhB (NUDIX family)
MALFNVRVYGILIDDQNRLLVSDEFIRGSYITKLPGGGLEIGEGTRDGLAREFMEEANLEVRVGEHFYTTDFFQISAFNNTDQIISIYYYVHSNDTSKVITKEKSFDFLPEQVEDIKGTAEHLRWVPLNELSESTMTLPIDKVAIKMLLNFLLNSHSR